MPYSRFLAWNAASALIWAPALVLAGFAAGSSYERVERYAGAAGLVLLAAGAAIAVVVFAARWLARHPDQVRGLADLQLGRPRVASLSRWR